MKYIYLLIIFSINFIRCTEKVEPIKCDDPNYIYDTVENACLCPMNTHFVINNKFNNPPDCIQKDKNSYFVIVDNHNCLSSGDFIAYGEKGFASFDPLNGSFILNWGAYYGLRPEPQLFSKPEEYQLNNDGSFKLVYILHNVIARECQDWKNRTNCSESIKGKAIGFSNKDMSEINFEILWSDCDGVVIDTGHMKIWRDW